MSDKEMKDGMQVQVMLAGEVSPKWYKGTVVKARKMWVELEDESIADENNIIDWKPHSDISLKAESECNQYYLCLVSENVDTKYHGNITGLITWSYMQSLMEKCDMQDLKYRSYQ